MDLETTAPAARPRSGKSFLVKTQFFSLMTISYKPATFVSARFIERSREAGVTGDRFACKGVINQSVEFKFES